MANKNNKTIFQRLTDVVIGTGNGAGGTKSKVSTSYNITPQNGSGNDILYTFKTKEERDQKLAQLKQQKLLSYQWKKIGYDSSMDSLAGGTQVRVMYRDADLMDQWPEIHAALDIISEEATTLKKGKMLNVYSKSERIKSILEDLFYNRLDVNIMLPMVIRDACKYGNEFMFLNVDQTNGIIGWRQLDVHQVRRLENGLESLYGANSVNYNQYNMKPDDVKFIWEGHNEATPFKNWQVAHFRLIKDSIYLPYGSSYLNGARRHWRMLSMMEDALFLHRLERSVERRIFKVNVGTIDEADVPAFLQDFANNFKRAPIVDPATGQIDLRKNFLDVSADYFIPVRPGQDPTSIDTLQSANFNQGMEDIEYIQNKILTILKVPKTFLNFTEAQGRGQNLSLLDIRFSRTINWIQQTILMELTKIAIIHLYILGFEDDLTNFSLSMNNPSNQIELMELDNMGKRLGLASNALQEQGGGIPLMSWYEVQKVILGKTDAEISEILNQIRLEAAIAEEIKGTSQIIKHTGLFDKADRIYGEPGAKYGGGGESGDDGGMSGAPSGGGFGGGDFGGGLDDLGAPGEEGGDIGGDEGGADMGGMPADDGGEGGGEPLQEVKNSVKNPILESLFDRYEKEVLKKQEEETERPSIINKGVMINEELMGKIDELSNLLNNKKDNKDILS